MCNGCTPWTRLLAETCASRSPTMQWSICQWRRTRRTWTRPGARCSCSARRTSSSSTSRSSRLRVPLIHCACACEQWLTIMSTSASASVPEHAHTRPCQCAPLLARLASPLLSSNEKLDVLVHKRARARARRSGTRSAACWCCASRWWWCARSCSSSRPWSPSFDSTSLSPRYCSAHCTVFSVHHSARASASAFIHRRPRLICSEPSATCHLHSPADVHGIYSTRTVHLAFEYVRAFYTGFVRVLMCGCMLPSVIS